jgi:NADH-quinone oxidoreductase subunit J
LGALVGLGLAVQLFLVGSAWIINPAAEVRAAAPIPAAESGITNTEALGRILYTKYLFFFEVAGIILLVAIVGAIVLTLRHKEGVRRQSIAAQVARTKETAMEVVEVAPGKSVFPSAD